MKAIAILGELCVAIYFITVILLTWHNISRTVFGHVFEDEPGIRFWMRQIMIIFWPLVLASEQGRYALRVIWTGKDDRAPPGRPDLDPFIEGDDFIMKDTPPRGSNRRVD